MWKLCNPFMFSNRREKNWTKTLGNHFSFVSSLSTNSTNRTKKQMLCILFIYWECTIISVYQFHIWKPQQKADTIEEAGEEEKNYCYNNNKATRRSEWISIKNDGMATKNHNNEKWANELAWSLSISFRLPLYTINFIYSTNRLYRESMVRAVWLPFEYMFVIVP